MKDRTSGGTHALIWTIFVLGFLIRAYGLSDQPPTDDEVAAAFSAENYLRHGLFGQVMWYHPPLRNLVVYLSAQLFGGYSAWGLRFGSLILGSLTIPVVGYLGLALLKRPFIACLAAFFVCIDPIHVTSSREAFQEALTIFFALSGVLSAYYGMTRNSRRLTYLAGLLFGLAISSKWHGLFPLAVTSAAYVAYPWLRGADRGRHELSSRLVHAFAAFTAIPVMVYIAVYIPWLLRGYSLGEFLRMQVWLLKHQYHYKGIGYDEAMMPHRAYEWFIKPVPWVDFVLYQGRAYVNVAMGNFLIWGLTLPSLLYCIRRWLKERRFGLGLLIALFLAAYLPLILTSRSVWVFLPPVVQYAFIFNSFALSRLWDLGAAWKRAVAGYIVLALLVSALMYPMSTFRAYEYPYLKWIAEMYSPHPADHPSRR